MAAGLGVVGTVGAQTDPVAGGDGRRGPVRELAGRLAESAQAGQFKARVEAARRNWPLRGRDMRGRLFELRGLRDGRRPVYVTTHNSNAAVSSDTHRVRRSAPHDVDGAGRVIGIWDGGSVRGTHAEFGGRAVARDGAAHDGHATHVGGTMAAAGVLSTATGMAPSATLHSYDWNADTSEMALEAAVVAGDTGMASVSNHSYGFLTGWANGSFSGSSGWHWFGANHGGAREDADFGRYSDVARDWDTICAAAPHYLPFKSAGNDRNDGTPANGQTYYYFSNQWRSATYDAATSPLPDGADTGGFDTISDAGNAKNVLTVGAVNDAVSGGVRDLERAGMTAFSGWGPADDGRVKPDLVANGASLYSTYNRNDNDYATLSGTSMSSPTAAGSALLLQDLHIDRGGALMPAALLKALLVHTADDLGGPGPDYAFGWGLLDTKAAADVIEDHFATPTGNYLNTGTIGSKAETIAWTVRWPGALPLRVTLCWTDPAGPVINGLDNRTPALVNDLDVRVVGPDGTVHLPYRLDPDNPSLAAVRGDNTVDTVESVVIAPGAPAGEHRVLVSMKNAPEAAGQDFALVITGQAPDDLSVLPLGEVGSRAVPGGSPDPPAHAFTASHVGSSGTLEFTVSDDAAWLDVNPTGGTLAPGQAQGVTATLNAGTAALPAGDHLATLTFRDTASGYQATRLVRLTIGTDPLTEEFLAGSNPIDLDNRTITFFPDGGDRYAVTVSPADGLPADPGPALGGVFDDGSILVSPAWATPFEFFGQPVPAIHINSNGNLTVGSGDGDWAESVADHFRLPRIAAVFDDLNPAAGGSVHHTHTPGDRAVVTYQNVPEYPDTGSNTFQIELFDDGSHVIRITYLGVSATDGIAGLSDGTGAPADFATTRSDFTTDYGPPPEITLSVSDSSAAEFDPDDTARVEAINAHPLGAPLSLPLTRGGTAGPTDATGVPDAVVIAAGQSAAPLVVAAVADTLSEGVETIGLALDAPAYLAIGGGPVTLTLLDTPADQWRFDELGGDGPGTGDLDDFDADGVVNLIEYAFGLDPATPDSEGLPAPAVDGAFLTLEYEADPNRPDVKVTGESSTDLEEWTADDVTWDGREFRTPLDGPEKFLRMRVRRATAP